MSDPCAAAVHAAELAVFQRKELMLKAASSSGLPGRFGSFHLGGLRASLATEPHYDFLNVVECVNNETLPALADTLDRFDAQNRPTVVATSPSPRLIARLRGDGYEPAPARPIAYMSLHAIHPNDTITEPWQIREVATRQDQIRFAALLEAGYEANNDVRSLIRAEHARPEIRAFIALRDNQPVAAAAMSVHRTGAVLGGASTLPRRGAREPKAPCCCTAFEWPELSAARWPPRAQPPDPRVFETSPDWDSPSSNEQHGA